MNRPAAIRHRWPTTADLAASVRDLLSEQPGITEKSMFGGLAFLSRGRMAVAVSSRGVLMVRVDPDEAAGWWRIRA